MQEPAIGLIELRSIARGMAVVDALVKKAPVHLRVAHPISPGHFILVFSVESPRSKRAWLKVSM